MKIAFDVDGVVLKSIDVILDHVNKATGRNLTPEDLECWDLEPLGLDLRTLWRAVDYMYAQPVIQPYEGAWEVLSHIHKVSRQPLLFITGRSRPETALKQLSALPWNPTVPEMIVTGGDRDKRAYLEETGADFILEDDVQHLGDYLSAGIGVGLMLQPWNRCTEIPVTQKFGSWWDVERWYMEMLGIE